MEIKRGGVRRTGRECVADLFLSDGVAEIKFSLYMRRGGDVTLRFSTTNRSYAEPATRLLREAGVDVKVYHKKTWHIFASLRRLAGADRSFKEAVVALIKSAAERGCVDTKRAQRWIAKIECVHIYNVGEKLAIYSKRREVLEREAQLLREMGLVEGKHFILKMPESGKVGHLRILTKGLAYVARLSVHGSGRQKELAEELLERILRAAQIEGGDAYKRVKKIIDAGISQDPLSLGGLEKEVENRVVKIRRGLARLDEKGRLKIAVSAEVGGIKTECEISFVKMKRGGIADFIYADSAEEAEHIAVVVKTLTGIAPTVVRMNSGAYVLRCNEKHLRAFAHYAELAGYVEKWMES